MTGKARGKEEEEETSTKLILPYSVPNVVLMTTQAAQYVYMVKILNMSMNVNSLVFI